VPSAAELGLLGFVFLAGLDAAVGGADDGFGVLGGVEGFDELFDLLWWGGFVSGVSKGGAKRRQWV
jgi:hypothetical protein